MGTLPTCGSGQEPALLWRTSHMAMMNDPRSPVQPMLCVAEVDTRLTCSTYCALCPYYVRDRRIGERRYSPRRTYDRRILGRL